MGETLNLRAKILPAWTQNQIGRILCHLHHLQKGPRPRAMRARPNHPRTRTEKGPVAEFELQLRVKPARDGKQNVLELCHVTSVAP